jgi:radical SAM protein with 4Fe4S-binding SPASM domain
MGSYDDVVYWIKRIRSEFKKYFNLHALTTITKYSLPYPKEIVNEFSNLGFNSMWPRFLNNLGYANNAWNEISYSPEEYLFFWKKLIEEVFRINYSGKSFIEMYTYFFSRKILEPYDPIFLDVMSPCGAAIGQLLYDNRGDIYTCDEAKVLGEMFKLGNVKTSTIKDVIIHPTVLSMMNVSSKLTTLCDKCICSPYCGLCPVATFMTEKTIVPKLASEFRCKVFNEMIKNVFEKILSSDKDREIILKWINTRILQ